MKLPAKVIATPLTARDVLARLEADQKKWEAVLSNYFPTTLRHRNPYSEEEMSNRSYFIELRVNFGVGTEKEKDALLTELMARTANALLPKAMLLADRSAPKIQLTVTNNITGIVDVDINKYPVGDECPSCGHELA